VARLAFTEKAAREVKPMNCKIAEHEIRHVLKRCAANPMMIPMNGEIDR
jgi:hypothetical protein